MAIKNKWFPFVSQESQQSNDILLFCFHHAGGTAGTYRGWTLEESPVNICCVELPGKGTRRNEKFICDFQILLPQLAENIVHVSENRKICLFGHSMGAAMAFYTAYYIKKHWNKNTEKIIVAGRQAPNKENPLEFKTYMGNDELMDELTRYNATPKEVLENRELLDFILPALRQDYKLNESLNYHGEILDIPIIAHTGETDYEANEEIMKLWKHVTTNDFQIQKFKGSHFFVTELGESYKQQVIQDVLKESGDGDES